MNPPMLQKLSKVGKTEILGERKELDFHVEFGLFLSR